MKYKTEFNFQKAVIVDEKMIREMVKEIEKYCDLIEYSSKLEKGGTIDFESLEELINFENSKVNSLKSIYITARDKEYKNRISVEIEAFSVFVSQFCNTISVEMTIDSTDKKAAFETKMKEIFERHEQEKKYNAISKNAIFNVLFAAYIIAVLFVAVSFIMSGFESVNKRLLDVWFVLSICYLIKLPFEKLQKKYYPPIVFYLGDGISIYDKNERARDGFFWTVIVGGIIGVIFLVVELFFSK